MAPTNAEYAKINIGCKELGIDKYDLIADRYGVESTKQLNRKQTWDLLEHLKVLGWKPKCGKKQKRTTPKYKSAAKRKVIALWLTMHETGVIKNKSDKALQSYVKRMTGVDRLSWCDDQQTGVVIQSLIEWAKREDVDVKH